MKSTVVIGAGISGLTAAYALQDAGREVRILERAGEVGGLARSLNLDGFIFDIGPHYFFLKTDPRADALLAELLGDEALVFDFQVSVLFRGKNIAWPPTLGSLYRLPFSSLFKTVVNGIRRRFPPEKDCQGFITGFYGKAVFDEFLGPYIQKKVPLLGPAKLHREWWLQVARDIHNRHPSKGSDQTKRIEARARVPLLVRFRAMTKMLLGFWNTARGKNLRKVLYPRGGMGRLCDILAERIRARGGLIGLNAGSVRLQRSENRISRVEWDGGAIEDPGTVIWTGSIHELSGQLDLPGPDLPFTHIVLGFVKIKRRLDLPHYLYTYYARPDVIFNRAYFPRLIGSGLVPEGRDAVCVEISPEDQTADPGRDDEELRSAILKGLERVSLCRPEDVEEVTLLDVRDAYPVYPLDYYDKLQALWKDLRQVENLWSIGRSAQFYYNNMARAMGVALDLAGHLTDRRE
ncbi:MAG: protoporphyrinogen/coproporphyrinogen oxidase [Planctomycetota bacterium]|jgi:protoporphyrinogen oxidase